MTLFPACEHELNCRIPDDQGRWVGSKSQQCLHNDIACLTWYINTTKVLTVLAILAMIALAGGGVAFGWSFLWIYAPIFVMGVYMLIAVPASNRKRPAGGL